MSGKRTKTSANYTLRTGSMCCGAAGREGCKHFIGLKRGGPDCPLVEGVDTPHGVCDLREP